VPPLFAGGTYQKRMTEELLKKFLNDRCTEEELKAVVEWVKNDALSHHSHSLGLHDWKNFKVDEAMFEHEDFDSLLDKIHHKINRDSRLHQKQPVASYTSWITRAAAILLLPVLGLLIYISAYRQAGFDKITDLVIDSLEIVTPVGSQTMLQLSDGSEVYLNYGSKLKYPQKFTGKTREVYLTGEGYFKVAHNPELPFVVKTSKLSITALGTTFNVLAYPGENVIETTLVEGKVVVKKNGDPQNRSAVGTMIPGQHVSYNTETCKVVSTQGDIERYVAWKDGRLIFKNESIVTITNRLSRWYNVEFEFKDESAKEFTYTATFVDETLFQILDLMTIATPVSYNVLPRSKLPDGTFTKQKVIIGKRI
jgi:ferric-dicitrate binding protein FerR (iron transport regulator)